MIVPEYHDGMTVLAPTTSFSLPFTAVPGRGYLVVIEGWGAHDTVAPTVESDAFMAAPDLLVPWEDLTLTEVGDDEASYPRRFAAWFGIGSSTPGDIDVTLNVELKQSTLRVYEIIDTVGTTAVIQAHHDVVFDGAVRLIRDDWDELSAPENATVCLFQSEMNDSGATVNSWTPVTETVPEFDAARKNYPHLIYANDDLMEGPGEDQQPLGAEVAFIFLELGQAAPPTPPSLVATHNIGSARDRVTGASYLVQRLLYEAEVSYEVTITYPPAITAFQSDPVDFETGVADLLAAVGAGTLGLEAADYVTGEVIFFMGGETPELYALGYAYYLTRDADDGWLLFSSEPVLDLTGPHTYTTLDDALDFIADELVASGGD